jgi:hypothetical protein
MTHGDDGLPPRLRATGVSPCVFRDRARRRKTHRLTPVAHLQRGRDARRQLITPAASVVATRSCRTMPALRGRSCCIADTPPRGTVVRRSAVRREGRRTPQRVRTCSRRRRRPDSKTRRRASPRSHTPPPPIARVPSRTPRHRNADTATPSPPRAATTPAGSTSARNQGRVVASWGGLSSDSGHHCASSNGDDAAFILGLGSRLIIALTRPASWVPQRTLSGDPSIR